MTLGVEIYSVGNIAAAAGVRVSQVTDRVLRSGIATARGYVGEADAIALVRSLLSGEPPPSDSPIFAAVVAAPERRSVFGLMTSSALHVLAGTILIVSFAWLTAVTAESEQTQPARLVFLMAPGPGGGGGGGGLKIPAPARRAERKAPAPRRISSPIPEVRQPPPPPEPKPEPKIEPPPPPPPPVVQAPVVPKPADPVDTPGVLAPPPDPRPNQGSGAGGGAGTGSGAGVGEGTGSGVGPGSGGGEGGGPYRPGAGIDPPTLQREVKALYTDDARRRGIEGDVVLEVVVRRDGSVGDVRIRRSLDRGLDQRAIDAVRQWRFAPARRHGVAVDILVEVAVAFKLR